MTKKKHFHSLAGKRKATAAYALFHRAAPSGSKYCPRPKKEKELSSATNTEQLKGGKQNLKGTVSASTIAENGGNVK